MAEDKVRFFPTGIYNILSTEQQSKNPIFESGNFENPGGWIPGSDFMTSANARNTHLDIDLFPHGKIPVAFHEAVQQLSQGVPLTRSWLRQMNRRHRERFLQGDETEITCGWEPVSLPKLVIWMNTFHPGWEKKQTNLDFLEESKYNPTIQQEQFRKRKFTTMDGEKTWNEVVDQFQSQGQSETTFQKKNEELQKKLDLLLEDNPSLSTQIPPPTTPWIPNPPPIFSPPKPKTTPFIPNPSPTPIFSTVPETTPAFQPSPISSPLTNPIFVTAPEKASLIPLPLPESYIPEEEEQENITPLDPFPEAYLPPEEEQFSNEPQHVSKKQKTIAPLFPIDPFGPPPYISPFQEGLVCPLPRLHTPSSIPRWSGFDQWFEAAMKSEAPVSESPILEPPIPDPFITDDSLFKGIQPRDKEERKYLEDVKKGLEANQEKREKEAAAAKEIIPPLDPMLFAWARQGDLYAGNPTKKVLGFEEKWAKDIQRRQRIIKSIQAGNEDIANAQQDGIFYGNQAAKDLLEQQNLEIANFKLKFAHQEKELSETKQIAIQHHLDSKATYDRLWLIEQTKYESKIAEYEQIIAAFQNQNQTLPVDSSQQASNLAKIAALEQSLKDLAASHTRQMAVLQSTFDTQKSTSTIQDATRERDLLREKEETLRKLKKKEDELFHLDNIVATITKEKEDEKKIMELKLAQSKKNADDLNENLTQKAEAASKCTLFFTTKWPQKLDELLHTEFPQKVVEYLTTDVNMSLQQLSDKMKTFFINPNDTTFFQTHYNNFLTQNPFVCPPLKILDPNSLRVIAFNYLNVKINNLTLSLLPILFENYKIKNQQTFAPVSGNTTQQFITKNLKESQKDEQERLHQLLCEQYVEKMATVFSKIDKLDWDFMESPTGSVEGDADILLKSMVKKVIEMGLIDSNQDTAVNCSFKFFKDRFGPTITSKIVEARAKVKESLIEEERKKNQIANVQKNMDLNETKMEVQKTKVEEKVQNTLKEIKLQTKKDVAVATATATGKVMKKRKTKTPSQTKLSKPPTSPLTTPRQALPTAGDPLELRAPTSPPPQKLEPLNFPPIIPTPPQKQRSEEKEMLRHFIFGFPKLKLNPKGTQPLGFKRWDLEHGGIIEQKKKPSIEISKLTDYDYQTLVQITNNKTFQRFLLHGSDKEKSILLRNVILYVYRSNQYIDTEPLSVWLQMDRKKLRNMVQYFTLWFFLLDKKNHNKTMNWDEEFWHQSGSYNLISQVGILNENRYTNINNFVLFPLNRSRIDIIANTIIVDNWEKIIRYIYDHPEMIEKIAAESTTVLNVDIYSDLDPSLRGNLFNFFSLLNDIVEGSIDTIANEIGLLTHSDFMYFLDSFIKHFLARIINTDENRNGNLSKFLAKWCQPILLSSALDPLMIFPDIANDKLNVSLLFDLLKE